MGHALTQLWPVRDVPGLDTRHRRLRSIRTSHIHLVARQRAWRRTAPPPRRGRHPSAARWPPAGPAAAPPRLLHRTQQCRVGVIPGASLVAAQVFIVCANRRRAVTIAVNIAAMNRYLSGIPADTETHEQSKGSGSEPDTWRRTWYVRPMMRSRPVMPAVARTEVMRCSVPGTPAQFCGPNSSSAVRGTVSSPGVDFCSSSVRKGNNKTVAKTHT